MDCKIFYKKLLRITKTSNIFGKPKVNYHIGRLHYFIFVNNCNIDIQMWMDSTFKYMFKDDKTKCEVENELVMSLFNKAQKEILDDFLLRNKIYQTFYKSLARNVNFNKNFFYNFFIYQPYANNRLTKTNKINEKWNQYIAKLLNNIK